MPRYRRNSRAGKKQSHLQSGLVMASAGAGLLLFLVVAWSLSSLEKLVSMMMICLNALLICLLGEIECFWSSLCEVHRMK